MSEPEGFFTKPWRGSDVPPAPEPEPAPAPASRTSSSPDSGGDPLAGFPDADVSAAVARQIGVLASDPSAAGPFVWQQALTFIEHGLAKCHILDLIASSSPDPVAKTAMDAAVDGERGELQAMRDRYQRLVEEYEASMDRAAEILQEAHEDAMRQEAARQVIRDGIAKAQFDLGQSNWEAGAKRSDDAHKAFIESLTNKYWSSS